jgi:myosin-5
VADVFKSVQQEYEEEGIGWNFVDFSDNAPVLDLIEGRMGLITVLNEECMLAKGTDSAFTSKLKALHADLPLLIPDRLNPLDFTIKHYAGPVKYTAAGFVSKNRDKLLDALSRTLATSCKPLVQSFFPLNDEDVMDPTSTLTSSSRGSGNNKNSTSNNQKKKGGGSIVAETVATKFRRQLQDLMETVAATRVQYIRCIKPNSSKQAGVMEPRMVLDQLRYAGVIEAIRISRSAYPNRLSHPEFVQRFRLLAPSAVGTAPDQDEAAQARGLLQHLLPLPSSPSSTSSTPSSSATETSAARPRWEMGRTRVYFTKGSLEGLEEARLLVLNRQATTLQRYFRGSRQAKAFRQLRQQAIAVQSAVRAWRQRASYRKERARVVQLQALWRRKRATKFVHARRLEARATTLQTAFRAHLQRARYHKARAGTIRLQALARRQQARKAYVVAVAEAKEQAKLENQLGALKRRLEEESEARRTAERKLHEAATNAPSALPQQQEPEPTSGLEAAEQEGSQDAIDTFTSSLSQEQGQLLEQLGRKVHSYREKYLRFKREAETYKKEVEALRAENQRVKDAHSAAGLSFSALNQHAANLQRVHKRLLREHQQAVEEAQRLEFDSIRDVQRLREEFKRHEEKLQAQTRRAKEELTGRIQMYELEVQMRIKQDRTMETMIGLVAKKVGDADPELVQELVEMQHTCKLGVREDVASRSSLIGGISSSTLLGAGGEEGSALSRVKAVFGVWGLG